MPLPKIRLLDCPGLAIPNVSSQGFRSTAAAVGHEILVWNPAFVSEGLKADIANDVVQLSAQSSEIYSKAFDRRLHDIVDFLDAGGVLFYFADGLNRQYRNAYSGDELSQPLLFPRVKIMQASGVRCVTEQGVPAEFAKLLGSYPNEVKYRFSGNPGTSFAVIEDTSFVVGFYERLSGGWIVTLPPLGNFTLDEAARYRVLEAMAGVATRLHARPLDEAAPEWAKQVATPNTVNLKNSIDLAEGELTRVQGQIAELNERLAEEQRWKVLFYAGDDAFHQMVINALNELGIHTVDGVHPHADALATADGIVFAIEAKAREKVGAKNVDISQCSTWVSQVRTAIHEHDAANHILDYQKKLGELGVGAPFSDDDDDAPSVKGVLVVNGYRDLPLSERKSPVFHPNQGATLQQYAMLGISGVALFSWMMKLVAAKSESDKKSVQSDFRKFFLEKTGAVEN